MQLRTRSRQPGSWAASQLISNATTHQTCRISLQNPRPKISTDHNPVGKGIPRTEIQPQSNTKCPRQNFFNSSSLGDLSNPIHPIFQPNNFVDPFIQYRPLENSLRLASRFLTTEQLLPFWYMLFSGPIETATKPPSGPSQPLTELNEQQKYETTTKLELLACCVTFTSERSWGRGDSGFTERLLLDAPSPFHGVKTNISISKRVFRTIDKSFAEPSRDNESRLWIQFLLVNLLLHELAHAAMYAAHPRPPAHDPIQAYFLPGARTTEEGMEWETSVFGGLLYEMPSFLFWEGLDGIFGSKIVLREWPSHRLVASYKKSIYPRPFPVKGTILTQDRLWLVPTTFFERLFTTAFWEETLPISGTTALRPSCTESFVSRGPLRLLVPDPAGFERSAISSRAEARFAHEGK